jgi:hypothetical protein
MVVAPIVASVAHGAVGFNVTVGFVAKTTFFVAVEVHSPWLTITE